ncbi:MAG TPA: hypothetical protein PLB88_10375 [Thermoanaerobaculaceae bacterium]|nr:hypothetical protein [Thermoanaerobaculaceae bacterium]
MSETDTAPTPGAGHNNPPLDLADIDPEKLLRIDVDQIAALLALNYGPLTERGAKLVAAGERWSAGHRTGTAFIIPDEDDNAKTSDFYRQLASFAGDTGETENARKRVKDQILQGGRAIDGWFGSLRDPVQALMRTINNAQETYIKAKLARERREREEAQRAALAEAAARAEAARQAERERALAERLAREGEMSAAETQLAEERARQARLAEEAAAEAAVGAVEQAQATPQEMVRSRSALGTTTSASGRWTWHCTDIIALCRAIADGKAPPDFVTTNDPVINAAVRGKNGRRECPGLAIEQEFGVRRSGG